MDIGTNEKNIMSKEKYNEILMKWQTGRLTDEESSMLKTYRVDNAIILAAGYSSRCLPLSNIIPKCLFRVHGEVMIERQIQQLLEVGIKDIIIVTGYKSELLEYLQEKYNVKFVYNEEYCSKNNLYSLWKVRKFLSNSYICAADNYYEENVFRPYVYESYYSCKYSDSYLNEYFVETNDDDYIVKVKNGGKNGWYTMGPAFFSKAFSDKFIELFEHDYQNEKYFDKTWDDYQMLHVRELPLLKEEHGEEVLEFDRIDEFVQYDKSFTDYMTKMMSEQ